MEADKSIEETVRAILQESFSPAYLNIVNESHKHTHHSEGGGGAHLILDVVSEAFTNQSHLQRHKAVYRVLDNLIPDKIHALRIRAMTPPEWSESENGQKNAS